MTRPTSTILVVTLGSMAALAGCNSTPADTFIAPTLGACDGSEAPQKLRVATWNIRATLSSSLDEIGDVLERLDADVIALQEVDREAERTGERDQAGELAARLGMQHAYAAARTEGSGDFGVALLSRLPFSSADRLELPADTPLEPRVALEAGLCAGDKVLRTTTTHIDVYPWAGEQNTEFLAKHVEKNAGEGVLVAGDMNAGPTDSQVESFTERGFSDAFLGFGDGATFGSRRIDYVFVDDSFSAVDGKVVNSDASDHRPLVIDLGMD